jgi:hypothetical protein
MKRTVVRRPRIVLLSILFMLAGSGMAQAMHQGIAYQGKLTDSSGQPIDGEVQMVFRIWSDSSPTLWWVETQSVVNVQGGLFNVHLGAVNPIPTNLFHMTEAMSLGIQVEGDGEMHPRIPLLHVPFAYGARQAWYAFRAQQADTADYATSAGSTPYPSKWEENEPHIYRGGSGNVGIGTATPGERLHVRQASGAVKAKIQSTSGDADLVVDAGGANNPTVEFHHNGAYAGGVGFDATRTNMFIYHNGTVAFKNGMVGIGTFTPTNHLEVHGNVLVTGQARGTFPRPDYDSGWVVLSTAGGSQDGVATLTHNLGGNVDNYVVDLMSRDPNSGYGINNHGIGTYPTERGFFFWNLTTTSLGIFRESSDVTSDEVRVRIWVYN